MAISISRADIKLIKAFLTAEMEDFTPPKTKQVSKLLQTIQEQLETSKPCSKLEFISLTNLGLETRRLEIYPDNNKYSFLDPTARIILCTCGNLSCWGSLTLIPFEPTPLHSAPGTIARYPSNPPRA